MTSALRNPSLVACSTWHWCVRVFNGRSHQSGKDFASGTAPTLRLAKLYALDIAASFMRLGAK